MDRRAQVGQDDTWKDVLDPTIGHILVYDVSATWHLDRLVFDPNEMRASAMEIARRRERRRLALLVSRTYYTWLRSRAAAVRAPSWAVRADQAAAELDALTEALVLAGARIGQRAPSRALALRSRIALASSLGWVDPQNLPGLRSPPSFV